MCTRVLLRGLTQILDAENNNNIIYNKEYRIQ